MKNYFPTKKQWKSWSLPSKLTAIGTLAGILGLALTLLSMMFFNDDEQANNLNKKISVIDEKVSRQNKAYELLESSEKEAKTFKSAAEKSMDTAQRQFLEANRNAFRLSEEFIASDPVRGGNRNVYLFEPYNSIQLLDQRVPYIENQTNADSFLWGTCPYSIIQCYRSFGLSPVVRPQAVIQSMNSDKKPHKASLKGFLSICTKFISPKKNWLGYDLCRGGDPIINDNTNDSSFTLRFSGTPKDKVLVIFDADGTRGVDFGSLGELHKFNIWVKLESGNYVRVDDDSGGWENPKNWVAGDFLSVVTDEKGTLVEIVVSDGFSHRAAIQSGVSFKKLRYDNRQQKLLEDYDIVLRTTRNDEKGLDGKPLPDLLQVCISSSDRTIGFLFYLWIIRYNYSNTFLQRWPEQC